MKINMFLKKSAVITIAIIGMQSCTSESPFSYEGEGTVSFRTEMYSDVAFETRDLDTQTKSSLEENLTIYIENSKGVIQRYIGKSSLPSSLTLPVGNYVIEGWTGDSASADFNKKFYRGYTPFEVKAGQNNTVKFDVNIANVIVSIDASEVDDDFLKDLKVEFNHTRGSLEFDNAKVTAGFKGYFMMPTNDNTLNYKVSLKGEDGNLVEREGTISNVERAHEYKLFLAVKEPENKTGSALIKIQIEDIPVLDQSMHIYPKPSFKATYGIGNDVIDLTQSQIECIDECYDLGLRIVGYGGLTNITMNFKDGFNSSDWSQVNGVNLKGSEKENAKSILTSKGIKIEEIENEITDYEQNIKEHVLRLNFSGADFLEKLEQIDTPYIIEVNAIDGRSYSNSIEISIARTEKAVTKNLVGSIEAPETSGKENPFAILTTSAELEGVIYSEEVQSYGIEYRIENSNSEFTQIFANGTRAENTSFKVKLEGLLPGTTYEYRAFADEFHESKTKKFTTEAKYLIPNANMNDWSTGSDKAYIPSNDGNVTFWDTGNHGSITLNKNLTTGDSNFDNGNMVAKLQSQFVNFLGIGKFGAGNLFVGKYVETNGTNGILQFGRQYNGSHPSALNVKVHYIPGQATKNTYNDKYIKQGEYDKGQIYIALTTAPIDIETADKESEAKLFNQYADEVLAYGELTFQSETQDTGLVETQIPFYYNDKAKTNAPVYLVIVCSASKYGDYFCGGVESTLYVDDFELEYGEIQWAD